MNREPSIPVRSHLLFARPDSRVLVRDSGCVAYADDRLTALAEAMADGDTPDWDSASAGASTDERAEDAPARVIADATRLNAELAVPASMSVRSILAEGRRSDALGTSAIPVTWGSLRIHEKIGRGRFGDVYRAWDPGLDRDVALKLLRHDDGAEDRLVVEEGRLMARVRHPNVVTIYGAAAHRRSHRPLDGADSGPDARGRAR